MLVLYSQYTYPSSVTKNHSGGIRAHDPCYSRAVSYQLRPSRLPGGKTGWIQNTGVLWHGVGEQKICMEWIQLKRTKTHHSGRQTKQRRERFRNRGGVYKKKFSIWGRCSANCAFIVCLESQEFFGGFVVRLGKLLYRNKVLHQNVVRDWVFDPSRVFFSNAKGRVKARSHMPW